MPEPMPPADAPDAMDRKDPEFERLAKLYRLAWPVKPHVVDDTLAALWAYVRAREERVVRETMVLTEAWPDDEDNVAHILAAIRPRLDQPNNDQGV